MNIKIKTKQIYDEHEEKQEMLHENASVSKRPETIIIELSDQKIIVNVKEKTLEILRDKNNILIKQNEEKSLIYETPYGKISLTTKGEKFLIQENSINILVEYQIIMNEQIEYKSQIEIIEI